MNLFICRIHLSAPEKLSFRERQSLFSVVSSAEMKVKASWTQTSEGEFIHHIHKYE